MWILAKSGLNSSFNLFLLLTDTESQGRLSDLPPAGSKFVSGFICSMLEFSTKVCDLGVAYLVIIARRVGKVLKRE